MTAASAPKGRRTQTRKTIPVILKKKPTEVPVKATTKTTAGSPGAPDKASPPGNDSNVSFEDSAWLQDPFIRMPMPRKKSGSKRSSIIAESKLFQPEFRQPRHLRTRSNKKDKSLDAQLPHDISLLPNGDVRLLPGEQEQMRLEDEVLWPNTSGLVELRGTGAKIIQFSERVKLKLRGSFVATNYRLYFLRRRTKEIWQLDPMTHVPLGEIDRIEVKENRSYRKKGPAVWLELGCKGARVVRFGFKGERTCESARALISEFTFGNGKLELSFAFSYKLDIKMPASLDGWNLYDAKKDYHRLNVEDKEWRISDVNKEYKLCPTYPRYLVVPSTISDEDLFSIAKFRSRGRIPVLIWRDVITGATIWRCSQPKVGIQYARNKSDEELFDHIRSRNGNKKLIIYDARPLKNALANKAVGKGYEESSYYRGTEVKFMNIENIHRVRESFQHARKAVLSCHKESDPRLMAKFEQSGWLKHIRTILKATYEMTARVHKQGASIVSHCSDGWDRTAQLISATELCLDSYYRTTDGFFCLIEKEWISFGHQFHKRLGHMIPSGDQDISPIFVQWLDTVWQIMRQHPTSFEFNSKMLEQIAYHATSLRFGTFLFDCDAARTGKKVSSRTVSLWTFLKASTAARRQEFTNPFYAPQKALVLYPAWDVGHVGIWPEFWLKHWYSSTQKDLIKEPPYQVHESQLPAKQHSEKMIHAVGHAIRNQFSAELRKRQAADKKVAQLNAKVERLKQIMRAHGIEEPHEEEREKAVEENAGGDGEERTGVDDEAKENVANKDGDDEDETGPEQQQEGFCEGQEEMKEEMKEEEKEQVQAEIDGQGEVEENMEETQPPSKDKPQVILEKGADAGEDGLSANAEEKIGEGKPDPQGDAPDGIRVTNATDGVPSINKVDEEAAFTTSVSTDNNKPMAQSKE